MEMITDTRVLRNIVSVVFALSAGIINFTVARLKQPLIRWYSTDGVCWKLQPGLYDSVWPAVLRNVVGIGVCGALVTTCFAVQRFYPGIAEDFRCLVMHLRCSLWTAKQIRRKRFLVNIFEETVATNGDKVFIRYKDEDLTYREVNQRAIQTARAVSDVGLQPGDTVALLLLNEPQFVWTYLGLLKLGIPVACINVTLRADSLVHCLRTCGANVCVVSNDADLTDAIHDIKADIPEIRIFSMEEEPKHMTFESFQTIVNRMPLEEIDNFSVRSNWGASDTVACTFTSGTTGEPKAVAVTQLDVLKEGSILSHHRCDVNDVVYVTAPLYHGSVLHRTVSGIIQLGATLALRQEFSAAQFWEDCRKYDVTVVTYMGEMCRYLLNEPVREEAETQHRVRLAVGHGLGRDIWEEFTTRFHLASIAESYYNTEYPVLFPSRDSHNVVGSIGRYSPLLRLITNVQFVRYDVETGKPIRNEQGFCIRTRTGEVGLMVVRGTDFSPLPGYEADGEATNNSLLRDVFRCGDCYYNSRDLMVVGGDYNVFFRGRVEDTFRWMWGNVSTLDISRVLAELPFLIDVCVYGVTVPGDTDLAAMAAVVLSDNEASMSHDQTCDFAKHCLESLPPRAVPRFIRVEKTLATTGTFRHYKLRYIEDGFDLATIEGSLYVFDKDSMCYTQLTDDIYKAVLNKEFKLH